MSSLNPLAGRRIDQTHYLRVRHRVLEGGHYTNPADSVQSTCSIVLSLQEQNISSSLLNYGFLLLGKILQKKAFEHRMPLAA